MDDRTYNILVDILNANTENNKVVTDVIKNTNHINERLLTLCIVVPCVMSLAFAIVLIYAICF